MQMSFKLIYLVFILILIGCAPALQMSDSEIVMSKPDEGQVFGSIHVTLRDDKNDSMWVSSLEGSQWSFKVDKSDGTFVGRFLKQERHELTAVAGGEESFFVTKLPVGDYVISECYRSGFSPTRMSGGLYLHFKVEPGKTIYIGKLVMELPKYNNQYFMMFNPSVKDEKENALAALKGAYKNFGERMETKLMQGPDTTHFGSGR